MADDDDEGEGEGDDAASSRIGPDAGNPAHVRKRETAQKLEQRERETFWRAVLSDPIGRREVWRLVNGDGGETRIFKPLFASTGSIGFPNEQATWFNAGMLAALQDQFTRLLILDRDGVMQMWTEQDSRFAKPKAP